MGQVEYFMLLLALQAPLKVLCAEVDSDNCLPDWKEVFGEAFDYVSGKNLRALNLLLAKHGGCIRSQIRQKCPTPFYVSEGRDLSHVACLIDETFIRLFSFSRRLECSDALCSNPDTVKWETPKSKQLRGELLMWFDIAPLKTGRQISAGDKVEIVSALLKNVYEFLQQNDFGGLSDFLKKMRLPNLKQINEMEINCPSLTYDWEGDLPCSWEKLLKEIVLLMSVYSSENDEVIQLTTSFDFREKLRQVNLKNIVDKAAAGTQKSLEQFAEEMTSVIDNRFDQLGDYFETLADYDGEIANADIGGALDAHEDKQRMLSIAFEELSIKLIETTQTVSTVNAIAALYKLYVTAIFAAAGAALGDFSGMITVLDKMDETAEATLNVARATKLTKLMIDLRIDMDKITGGLTRNRRVLENARHIIMPESGKEAAGDMEKIRWEFLQAYSGFDLQVDSADIKRISQGMTNVLNVIKEVLDSSTQFAATLAGKAKIVASTSLEDMALLIPQITELLESRIRNQSRYMGSLAAYLRAQLAKSSVQQLQKSIKSSLGTKIAQNQAALTALIISKSHTLQAVRKACNVLQYNNAGETPAVCTAALASLSDSDIADVLAFLPESCVENTNDGVYVSIPVSDGVDKPGTINLQDLYVKKRATLEIPNVQWLVDHGWLLRSDAEDKVFYVKGFELFLLSLEFDSQGRHVGVDISPGSPASLVKGQKRYEIKPKQIFEFTYRENIPPCDKKEANPYELCMDMPLSTICVAKDGVINNDLDLYPSIFSKWIFEVPDLGSHTDIPTIKNGDESFSLQAKIMLCSKSPKKKLHAEVNSRPHASSEYRQAKCGKGNFYDRKALQWRKCPAGSSAALGGYYCKPGN
ncbi:hypothetical protein ACHWQZ_G000217 [Mnemiopsis leidyi]